MNIKNKSYILEDLCAVRDQPAYLIHGMPNMTNRFSYIIKRLIDFNVPFEIDRFTDELNQTFFNGYVYLNGFDESKDTLIFMAHHDVLNTEFDNFNDNSASVFLLMMFSHLFNKTDNLEYNLLVVFTDAEERGFRGAERLKYQIEEGKFSKSNIIHIINLELCGVGNSMWIENHNTNDLVVDMGRKFFKGSTDITDTPSSDATFLRSQGMDNITTIGLLNKIGGEFDKSPWSLVHTKRDRYENGNILHMENLFDFLRDFAIEINDMYIRK